MNNKRMRSTQIEPEGLQHRLYFNNQYDIMGGLSATSSSTPMSTNHHRLAGCSPPHRRRCLECSSSTTKDLIQLSFIDLIDYKRTSKLDVYY